MVIGGQVELPVVVHEADPHTIQPASATEDIPVRAEGAVGGAEPRQHAIGQVEPKRKRLAFAERKFLSASSEEQGWFLPVP